MLVSLGIVLLSASAVQPQVLVNFQEYFVRVIQETIWELEEHDWCNFRIPTIHDNRRVLFHGWTAEYEVDYQNGFLVSFSAVNIVQSSVTTRVNDTIFSVQGQLQFHDVVTGYDVVVKTPQDEQEQHYSGLYTHLIVSFNLFIEKTLATDEISVRVDSIGSQGVDGGRMQFLPQNNLTETMSRFFFSHTPSFASWQDNITPALEDVAKHRFEFPRACYATACQ